MRAVKVCNSLHYRRLNPSAPAGPGALDNAEFAESQWSTARGFTPLFLILKDFFSVSFPSQNETQATHLGRDSISYNHKRQTLLRREGGMHEAVCARFLKLLGRHLQIPRKTWEDL